MKEYICKEVPAENGGYLEIETELIRCKDCARNPNNGKARTICPCPMDRYMGPEGHCSKAEPKENDR